MSQIKVHLIILTLWFALLSQLNTILPGSDNLEMFTFIYLIGMSIAMFLLPGLAEQGLVLSTIVAQFLYVFNYLTWGALIGTNEPYLFVIGLVLVQVTLMLMRWVSLPLVKFDQAAENFIFDSKQSNLLNAVEGEEEINHELYRARRFERSFSIVYCEIPDTATSEKDALKTDFVNWQITKDFKRRYTQVQLVKLLSSIIYKSDILVEYRNGIVVGLPETNADDAKIFINRLGLLVKDNFEVTPIVGTATFPEEGLIYDDLVKYAYQNAASWDYNDVMGMGGSSDLGKRLGELMVDTDERLKIERTAEWVNKMPTPSPVARKSYQAIKRSMDIAAVLIVLPLILPVMAMIAALIYLDDGDNIFYMQPRTGLGGKRFHMYKFRTMYVGVKSVPPTQVVMADGSVRYMWPEKTEHDPRITRIGRFLRKSSLDELPQLLNVLKGDMSLVGPRPTTWSLDMYTSHQTERLAIRPGITGLWQVSARETTNFDERLLWDMKYIEKCNMWLDIQIIFQTVTKVFQKAGV